MTVRLSIFSGPDIAPTLRDLAQLCTIVFRDWPHLYDGDGRYDPDHLQALAASQRSAVVMAYDGEVPVGAATCLPLEDAAVSYQAPFLARAWPVEKFFYLAEAVLLPEYRGRGIGAAFLALRETHIRAVADCEFACFCAVERPDNHPARPSNWVPLNAFLATTWLFAGSGFPQRDAVEGIWPQ